MKLADKRRRDRPGFIAELMALMGKYSVEQIEGPGIIFMTADLGTPLAIHFDRITPTEVQ